MQQWFSRFSPGPAFHGHSYSAAPLPGQMPMGVGVPGHATGQGPSNGEALPVMAAPWQQQNSGEHIALEDPLFGFNGSALDDFSFLGW